MEAPESPGAQGAPDSPDSPAAAAPAAPKSVPPPTAMDLFLLFASISAVTVGGGYAIVPVIGRALERRGWMDEDSFHDIFARAQAFPGPIALSTAMLCSRRLCGPRAQAAAIAGVILPPFAALVLVGSFLGAFGTQPGVRRFLAGAGATIPGLVAALLYRTAIKRKWNLPRAVCTVLLAAGLAALPSLSLPVLLGALAILYVMERRWNSSR